MMKDVFKELKGKGKVKVYTQGQPGKLSELLVTIEYVGDEVVLLQYGTAKTFAVALDKVIAVEAKPKQFEV